MNKKNICIALAIVIFALAVLGTILLVSNANKNRATDDVAGAKEKLTVSSPIETNTIVLPDAVEGFPRVVVTWTSNKPAVINAETGKVTRPSYAEGDVTVVLTATLTCKNVSDTKQFTVIVKCLPPTQADLLAEAKINAKKELDALLGDLKQTDYTEEIWEVIVAIVNNGKAEIDLANTIADVATAKSDAIRDVNNLLLEVQKLKDAKAAKLAQVPNSANYTQADYTVASWSIFTAAITTDINAINACTTVAQVEQYVITANENMLVTIQSVADAFRATHADALSKTVLTVNISHTGIVNSALTAYAALPNEVKAVLTEEKALLDSLWNRINEMDSGLAAAKAAKIALVPNPNNYNQSEYTVASWAIFTATVANDINAIYACTTVAEVEQYVILATPTVLVTIQSIANTFKSNHFRVLGLTTSTVQSGDKDDVSAALTAYAALPNEVKAVLTEEKALLDSLWNRINEMDSGLAAAKAAKIALVPNPNNYNQSEYTVASWAIFTTAVTNDINLINDCTTVEEVESYVITANENMLVTIESVANAFKTAHSRVLAFTTGTVQIIDKADVNAALTAYGQLVDEVKAVLGTEKGLLDNLLAKIGELELAEAKATKLAQVPSPSNYNQSEYTVASWSTFTNAVQSDINAINACTTVEQVTAYTITANESMLVTIASLVEKFRQDHAAALALDPGGVTLAHKDIILAALSDYASLPTEVQAQLGPEKAKLDSLMTALAPLLAAEWMQAHAEILATAPNIANSNKSYYFPLFMSALNDYNSLPQEVKDLLADQYAHLRLIGDAIGWW